MSDECEYCKEKQEELEQWKKEALVYRKYNPKQAEFVKFLMDTVHELLTTF